VDLVLAIFAGRRAPSRQAGAKPKRAETRRNDSERAETRSSWSLSLFKARRRAAETSPGRGPGRGGPPLYLPKAGARRRAAARGPGLGPRGSGVGGRIPNP
jgi:hypothetical protein